MSKLALPHRKRKLLVLADRVKSEKDDELKHYLSMLLCIYTSGYLEEVLKSCLLNFTKDKSPKQVEKYVLGTLKNITNLKDERICKLLNDFDRAWGQEFRKRLGEEKKESLNSLIGNRNSIAHGQTPSVTPNSILKYHSDTIEICDILADIIKK